MKNKSEKNTQNEVQIYEVMGNRKENSKKMIIENIQHGVMRVQRANRKWEKAMNIWRQMHWNCRELMKDTDLQNQKVMNPRPI